MERKIMKKTVILSSLLSIGVLHSANSSNLRLKIQRVSIDVADKDLMQKVETLQRLKKANVLQSSGNIWSINHKTLKLEEQSAGFEDLKSLREMLGPHIDIEKVDALEILLSTQDFKL